MTIKDLLIELPAVTDDRGRLCIAEEHDLPFPIKRIFWIYDIGKGKSRGGHAHLSCEEVVVAVRGGFDMYVDDGYENMTVRMSKPSSGIYIPKGVWCELRNFEPGTICVVMASEAYNANGYINDYELFKLKTMKDKRIK